MNLTNQEILQKAIEKAVDGGWDKNKWHSDNSCCFIGHYFIFSHEFAKALGFKVADLGAWVDEGEEPIKYLEKFL